MHEFSVTEAIIKGLLDQLQRESVSKVTEVHFRRSSAFSEEVLRQTFCVLSIGTPLEGAELNVEGVVLNVTCAHCHECSDVNSEDLIGHLFVCPTCGTAREIAEAHDLELVKVIAQTEDSLDSQNV
ncbi:MAG: hydrogenase maturation nickel metallochaperone HypA [Chloroflexota bacterium]